MTFLRLKHSGLTVCLDKIVSVSRILDDEEIGENELAEWYYWFVIHFDGGGEQVVGYGRMTEGEGMDNIVNGVDVGRKGMYARWCSWNYIYVVEDYLMLMNALGIDVPSDDTWVSRQYLAMCKEDVDDSEKPRRKPKVDQPL